MTFVKNDPRINRKGRLPSKLPDWPKLFREAINEDEFREIVAALVKAAKAGDMGAIKLVLDRTVATKVMGHVEVTTALDPLLQAALIDSGERQAIAITTRHQEALTDESADIAIGAE